MYTVDPITSGVHHVSVQVLAGQPAAVDSAAGLAPLAVAVTLMLTGFAVEALARWVRKAWRNR